MALFSNKKSQTDQGGAWVIASKETARLTGNGEIKAPFDLIRRGRGQNMVKSEYGCQPEFQKNVNSFSDTN